MNKTRLISFYLIIVVLSLIIIVGCATVEKPILQPFTPISFVEIQDENIRVYHIRYPDNLALAFDLTNKLYKIEGVKGVYPEPYEFRVIRSLAYSWNEIEQEIKKVLLEFGADIKDGYIGEHGKEDEKKQIKRKEGV